MSTHTPSPFVDGGREAARASVMPAPIPGPEDGQLAAGSREIGQPVGPNERELFVSCDPGPALQQQLELLTPAFIAVHGVGTPLSRRLLEGIAEASERPMQKLTIRKPGQVGALAVIAYVDVPNPAGAAVRLCTTHTESEAQVDDALSSTLLAFSRLAVLLVPEMTARALGEALKPLHEQMRSAAWRNRHLLLIPLSSVSSLALQGVALGRGTAVNVRATPRVASPADAWGYISATWSGLGMLSLSGASSLTQPALPGLQRESLPLPLRPMPVVALPATLPASSGTLLEHYARQVSELTGAVGCCVFEVSSGSVLAHAGAGPAAPELAFHGSEMIGAMLASSRTLGLGHKLPDAAVTLGNHHLLLRAVPGHPGLAIHALLDKTHANLTLFRLKLLRLDAMFDGPPRGELPAT